jgi:outer membrane protein assembly factor BamB
VQAYGLVPGNGVVIVEAGHEFGHAPALVTYGVTEYVALDLSTGRRLWTAGVPGHLQNPPIAISGKLVLTAALSGAITARQAATGDVLWRRQPPSDCWRRAPGPPATAIALAADQTRVAASFECAGYRTLVQMLDPRTGALSWSWESPQQPAGAVDDLAVTGVASQGDVVLLTGQDAGPDAAYRLARAIPRMHSWPPSLGPPDDIQVVLALDARTGQPRWIELGGQMVSFTLADGAICETVSAGLECRDDVTGAPTGPVLVTGQADSSVPPIGGDASAGISGSVAAVTVAPFRTGHVTVSLVPIRGDRPLGQANVGTGTSLATAGHATEQPFVVAAGTLPSGRTLVLLRRVDLPDYPVVALEVASAPG